MKLEDLRAKRDSLLDAQKALVEGDFNADAQAQFDNIDTDLKATEKHIQAIQDVAAREAAKAKIELGLERGLSGGQQTEAGVQAFAKLLKGGREAMNMSDWDALRNTQQTTSAGSGGITVPTTTMSYITEALKDFGGARAVAKVISTASGETMIFPTTDSTAERGEILAEGSTAAALDTAFSSVSCNVYQYSSKSMAVSRQLMSDSAVDIVSHVLSRLAERIARTHNEHFTTGTGTNQPVGLVTASSLGFTAANTAAITSDALLELFHSLEPAYRNRAVWMMNDTTFKVLRKLKDTTGRSLLQGEEMGNANAWDGTLFGKRVVINQEMPSIGAAAKPIVFGNFDYFLIRDVNGFSMDIMTDSNYTLKNEVGYVGFARAGSVNTGIGNLKHLLTTAA